MQVVVLASVFLAWSLAAHADGFSVDCDVDRNAARRAASGQATMTFRLWETETGGAQCGGDHTVPIPELLTLKEKRDRIADEKAKVFWRVEAFLPAGEVCAGSDTWLDVQIGTQTFTCDFSNPTPQARRRLTAVPFAQAGNGGNSDAITLLHTGAGLQGGPITSTGTVSVDAPTCSSNEKLTWTGSGFACAPDQTEGGAGTVTSVQAGAGLTGGPITTSGALSIDAPVCPATDMLTWNGSAFQCASIPPATDVQCAGCVCSTDVGSGCIGSSQIQDGSITGGDIAPGTITSDKLAPGAGGARTVLFGAAFLQSFTCCPPIPTVQWGGFPGRMDAPIFQTSEAELQVPFSGTLSNFRVSVSPPGQPDEYLVNVSIAVNGSPTALSIPDIYNDSRSYVDSDSIPVSIGSYVAVRADLITFLVNSPTARIFYSVDLAAE
jgi:hypothetical protein